MAIQDIVSGADHVACTEQEDGDYTCRVYEETRLGPVDVTEVDVSGIEVENEDGNFISGHTYSDQQPEVKLTLDDADVQMATDGWMGNDGPVLLVDA